MLFLMFCITHTVSSTPSPSSSSFSDKEHLRKISKSVPSFLDNEVQYDYIEDIFKVIFLLLYNKKLRSSLHSFPPEIVSLIRSLNVKIY